MYCTRMRAKSREAALFPSSFLLPSHAEAEGLDCIAMALAAAGLSFHRRQAPGRSTAVTGVH